jgi:hypothetical protein
VTSGGPDRTGGRLAGRRGIFARTFRRQRDLARLPPVPLIVQDTPEPEAARVCRDVSHWYARAGSRRP